MRATRRLWATAAIGVVYTGVAVGTAQPLAFVGSIGIGGWVLATSWAAQKSIRELDEQVEITYTVETATTYVDAATTATLEIERPARTADTMVTLSPSVPPGLTTAEQPPQIELEAGETTATVVFPIQTPVAGVFALPAPEIAVTDTAGLYTETLTRGPEPTVTVLPRTPTVHIGKGGQPYGNAFGEHATDQPGPGIAVRELRQYTTGEDAMNIDWKSTARLGEPYVRETEGETDRKTVLVVDHRAQSESPDSDLRPVEFAREAALAMAASAVKNNDPLSLWTIGDAGVSNRITAGSDPSTYNRIRSTLFDLEPASPQATVQTGGGGPTAVTERLAAELAFTKTLEKYTSRASKPHATDHEGGGLLDTVRRIRAETGSEAWLVVITTDADPAQLRESVTVATQGGAEVCLLVMPTALFGAKEIETAEQTYNRYLEFENLRRDLDAQPRVTALELAPGDRLSAVLSTRQQAENKREA